MKSLAAALAGGGAILCAAAAHAESQDYVGCDGYGAATAEGDGMTKYAMTLGIFNFPGEGNTLRQPAETGAAGVADCDAALSELPDKFWMRKVSLLTARAAHDLEKNDATAALADLDRADAAAVHPDEPFYTRSLGLGVRYIRAYALRVSGDSVKAMAVLEGAQAARPYLRQAGYFSDVDLGNRVDEATHQRLMQDMARLDPRRLDQIFLHDFNHSQYAAAVALFPELVPPRQNKLPPEFGRAKDDFEAQDRALSIVFFAARGAQCAYALAALGRMDAARAMLTTTRARLASDTADPPLDAADASSDETYARMMTINMNAKARSYAEQAIDQWRNMVDLRAKATDGPVDEAVAAIKAHPPMRLPATLELLDILAAKSPDAAAQLSAARTSLVATIVALPAETPDNAITDAWKNLPEAETAARMPSYTSANKPLFSSGRDFREQGTGYHEMPGVDPGVTVVRFRGMKATDAIVGEMALLRACELARQAGKKGLIVVGRRDVKYTLTMTSYGQAVRTDPQGFESELDVVFVDPNALLPPFANSPWRVIDVDAAYAALAPIYLNATPGS